MIRTDGARTIANGRVLQGFSVRNEGTLFLFQALDAEAQAWLAEHVDLDDAQHFGRWLVVEHRYAFDLLDGIFDAGFAVQ